MNSQELYDQYKNNLRSPFNAPNVGELNTKKIPPFIEPDLNLKRRFKNGVIWIQTETRHQHASHRRSNHQMTKFDCREDPSWHVKNRQMFSNIAICTSFDEGSQVSSLDDLGLVDNDGNAVSQAVLDEFMAYLNGKKMVGNFSTITSMHRQNQNQRAISRLRKKVWCRGEIPKWNEAETRDRRRILDGFDSQWLEVYI